MRKQKFAGLVPEQLWTRARRLVMAAKRIDPSFTLASLAEIALERALPGLERKYGVTATSAVDVDDEASEADGDERQRQASLPRGRPMKP